MAESEEFIQLQVEDDFPVIRRRLAGVQAERVYLLVPPTCVGLRGEVQLRLLARVLGDVPYRLALVTSDWSLFKQAESAKVPAFLSLQQAQDAPWQKWVVPQPPRLSSLRQRRPTENRVPRAQRGEVVLFLSMAGGLTLLSFLAVILFLPEAEVTIAPLTSPIEGSFTVIVDPQASEIDENAQTIPGATVEVELLGTEGIQITTYRDQPSTAAEGQVIFINLTSDPLSIPKGTVVSTSAGTYIRFSTQTAADLPAGYGQQVRVPVVAVDPGPAGNVPALAINRVEGFLSFAMRVINDQPTQGGTAVQVPLVTLEDKNILKGRLLQRLGVEGANNLKSQLAGQVLLPGYPQLIVRSESYDHAVGDEAGALNLELRVLARGMAINESDLATIALSLVQAQVGPEMEVLPQGMEFILGEPQEEDGKVILPITVRAQITSRLDEGEIKGQLLGKPIPQAQEYLIQQLSLSRDPQVKVTPAGWPIMPWLPTRIEISIIAGGG